MEITCRDREFVDLLEQLKAHRNQMEEEVRSLLIPVRRTGLRSGTLVRFRLPFSHRLPLISDTCPASCR
jgi:hypothetical protein